MMTRMIVLVTAGLLGAVPLCRAGEDAPAGDKTTLCTKMSACRGCLDHCLGWLCYRPLPCKGCCHHHCEYTPPLYTFFLCECCGAHGPSAMSLPEPAPCRHCRQRPRELPEYGKANEAKSIHARLKAGTPPTAQADGSFERYKKNWHWRTDQSPRSLATRHLHTAAKPVEKDSPIRHEDKDQQ